jgi:hypothetical protein
VSEVQSSLSLPGELGRWLTFTGVAGCGKTMLMSQIFDEVKRLSPHNGPRVTGGGFYQESSRRPRSVWMEESSFAEKMRGGEYDLPEYLAQDWIVAIDDIGSSRDKTDFLADALYRLCNARLGRWTMFTTNLTLGELASRVDERVASRLIRDGNVVCQIGASDYALRNRRHYES